MLAPESEASSDPPRRATGASLAVIILVASGLVAVVLLHLLRTDLDPVREVMSGYANGSFGVVMTVAFYALGVASILMSFRFIGASEATVASRAIPVLLALGGVGLIVAGIFEVERPLVPDTLAEVVHSDAAIVAFLLLIAAMVLLAYVCRCDPNWYSFFGIAVALATLATVAAAFSPLADQTPWTGIAQRVLGLAVFAWLLLVAVRIRFHQPATPGGEADPA